MSSELANDLNPVSAPILIRSLAALVDLGLCVLVSAGLIVFGLPLWLALVAWLILVEIGWHVHGSLGKHLLGLKVESLSRGKYYLRETVGKALSLGTLGIGWLAVLSSDRLALHDYLAGTRVVVQRRTNIAALVRYATAAVFLLLIAYFSFQAGKGRRSAVQESPVPTNPLEGIAAQLPGVLAVYTFNRDGKPESQGSGFVVSADGVAVTNFHVFEDAYSAEAELGDGRLFDILRIQAFDINKDLLTFQLGRMIGQIVEWPDHLNSLTLGTAKSITVGTHVAAVTSPQGLTNTISDGVVSGIRNELPLRLLQVTAPLSPGSSGGPIFDMSGKVVAVAAQQLSVGQNLNFAIPIDEVVELVSLRQNLSFVQFRKEIRGVSKGQKRRSANRDLR